MFSSLFQREKIVDHVQNKNSTTLVCRNWVFTGLTVSNLPVIFRNFILVHKQKNFFFVHVTFGVSFRRLMNTTQIVRFRKKNVDRLHFDSYARHARLFLLVPVNIIPINRWQIGFS